MPERAYRRGRSGCRRYDPRSGRLRSERSCRHGSRDDVLDSCCSKCPTSCGKSATGGDHIVDQEHPSVMGGAAPKCRLILAFNA
jgi:hypothetical protein